MKNDFLKQLETANFTPDFIPNLPPDLDKPGIPCDHPGCASHLSHPCEGCGRYAAGGQNGPDVDHAKRYIENLAINDTVIHSFLMLKEQNNWTWEQVLMAIVIKQNEIDKEMADKLNDAISKRPVWHPGDRLK